MVFQLNGERIILRIPKPSDANAIYKCVRDKTIVRYMTIPYPYRLKHAKDWIKKSNERFRKKTDYEFSIVFKVNNEIVGGMSLMHVDKKNQNAEVGYWLAKKYWGQGLAKEALKLALNFGFRRLKLRKMYAGVFEPNMRSSKLLESMGFRLEGKFRQHTKDRFSKNKWFNDLRYGLLKSEYEF